MSATTTRKYPISAESPATPRWPSTAARHVAKLRPSRLHPCRTAGDTESFVAQGAQTRRHVVRQGLQSACKLLVPARRAPRTCPLPRRRGGRVRLKAAVLKTARAQALGSSNLPPSVTSSPIAFATCRDDRRARRKVPGRVPVLTLGAGGDGVWCGVLLGAEGCPPRRRISSGVSSRR